MDVSAVCEDLTKRFQAFSVVPKPPPPLLNERRALKLRLEGPNKRIDKQKAGAGALEQEVQVKRTELTKLSDELGCRLKRKKCRCR